MRGLKKAAAADFSAPQLSAISCRSVTAKNGTKLFFYLCKLILAYAADRACPVIREILECCAGSDTVIRIANRGIIDISARAAYILVHRYNLQCFLLRERTHFLCGASRHRET